MCLSQVAYIRETFVCRMQLQVQLRAVEQEMQNQKHMMAKQGVQGYNMQGNGGFVSLNGWCKILSLYLLL